MNSYRRIGISECKNPPFFTKTFSPAKHKDVGLHVIGFDVDLNEKAWENEAAKKLPDAEIFEKIATFLFDDHD